MKAAYIEETGPAENIQVGELPTPQPQGSEVLVKVTAAALNPIDTYLRNGANYWELPMPFVVGCDLAGVVEQVGPEAKNFKVGDRVWGSNQGLLGRQGTFAEYACVDECWLYNTPDKVTDDDAVACALVGITAHLGLVRDAKLQAGESIFVHGGTGGVGSMVVQMAKALGARVITTGGSDEKVQKCLELGADAAVNYKTDDVAEAVKKFAPEGVNVVWETLREPDFELLTDMLAERGRLVLMAGRDARPPFPVGPFYVKGCSLHGFVMFKASPEEQQQSAEAINQWLATGKLKANISKILPLDQAAQSHKLQEENTLHQEGSIAGKILVKP
jgi:NADPH2:quinone reductase